MLVKLVQHILLLLRHPRLDLGANATFTITRDGNGDIDTVVVVDRGTGYAYNDTITIAADITDTADLIITVTAIGTVLAALTGKHWHRVINVDSTKPWDILYRNASGANVNLPIGTEGQILTVEVTKVSQHGKEIILVLTFIMLLLTAQMTQIMVRIFPSMEIIRYALAQTAGLGTVTDTVSIFVKSGTYEEQLLKLLHHTLQLLVTTSVLRLSNQTPIHNQTQLLHLSLVGLDRILMKTLRRIDTPQMLLI